MAKPYAGGRGRRDRGNYVRKNERIRAREVRLLGPDGQQIGVVSRDEALTAAKRVGLDLVEISASARPPVCRILDFGKYMYEEAKRKKENKSKGASSTKIKEVKFRVRTEEHDYMTKLRHGEEFLYKGNKLKMSLMFRGRENEHKPLGLEVVAKAAEALSHVGQADGTPRLSGRHVNLMMSPLPVAKRSLKYNEAEAPQEEAPQDEAPQEEVPQEEE
jgi:translation initiation factor IF-3